MIQLDAGICYSPRPNDDYRYTHIIEQGGLASFFKDDLQMWNLAWLTDPNWDCCLNVQTPDSALQALRKLDAELAGLVKRSLTMEDDVSDFGTPTLRSLLKLPPREFMRKFASYDLMTLELTATYGSPLIQTMWSRARQSQPITPDREVTKFIEQCENNVIQFKRRQADEKIPSIDPPDVESDQQTPLAPTSFTPAQIPTHHDCCTFDGRVVINGASAKIRLALLAEEVISVLAADPDAEVKITVDIEAKLSSDVTDQFQQSIAEKTVALGFQKAQWK
jgi:hypothetical protein